MAEYTKPAPLDIFTELIIHLEVPVALNIAHLLTLPKTHREYCISTWPQQAGHTLGHLGDTLQFKPKKPGRPAEAFSALARGIAAAAFLPGGITVGGRTWDVSEGGT